VTVAIVGPDGSGKSTLAEAVAATLELPASTQYMGLYQRVDGQRQGHAALPALVVTQLRRWLSARRRQAQGEVVLFDRYPVDARLPPTGPLRGRTRVRRWILAHAAPLPDIVAVLDAPGTVLAARAPDSGGPEEAEERRQRYQLLPQRVRKVMVLDATRPVAELAAEVSGRIAAIHAQRSA
jgi:thymidylate kinase